MYRHQLIIIIIRKDYSWPTDLPDTSNYVKAAWIECETLPDPVIPEIQSMPKQEMGVKISRALPYEFIVTDKVTTSSLELTIDNIGQQGAAFIAFDVTSIQSINPLKYSVSSKTSLTSSLKITTTNGDYDFHLQGANGFVRNFNGNSLNEQCSGIQVSMSYQPETFSVVLNIVNGAKSDSKFVIIDNAYGNFDAVTVSVPAMDKTDKLFSVQASGNWYDITTSLISNNDKTNNDKTCFSRRFMGRLETGFDSISDPAMSAGLPGLWITNNEHPILSENVRKLKRVSSIVNKFSKDGICNVADYCEKYDNII